MSSPACARMMTVNQRSKTVLGCAPSFRPSSGVYEASPPAEGLKGLGFDISNVDLKKAGSSDGTQDGEHWGQPLL